MKVFALALFLASGLGGCATFAQLATPANINAAVTLATAIVQAAKQ